MLFTVFKIFSSSYSVLPNQRQCLNVGFMFTMSLDTMITCFWVFFILIYKNLTNLSPLRGIRNKIQKAPSSMQSA